MTTVDTSDRLNWGTRGHLGFIDLSTSIVLGAELPRVLPDQVGGTITKIRLPRGEATAAALREMVDGEPFETATLQLADGGAQSITFACTTGSLVGGKGYDEMLISRMRRVAPDIQCSTTSTAVVSALRAVDARSVAIVTPYIDELNVLEAAFLEAEGFEVASVEGLQIGHDRDIAAVPYSSIERLVERSSRAADAIFISCMNLPTLPIISRLEKRFSRPVVTSVSATIWASLRTIGISRATDDFGSLLAS